MEPIPLHFVWNYTDVDRAFWRTHLEEWVPPRIFDAHTHINEPEFDQVEMTEEKRRQYWVNELHATIGADDAKRCMATVFPKRDVSCLCFGHPTLEFDIKGSNARLAEDCVRYRWYRLAVTRPQWSAEEVAAELDKPRTLGVKVYYALIENDPTSRDKYLEASIFDFLPHHQLELLDERRAWVTLHVPKADRLGHPDNIREIRELRRRYPNVIVVIAHLGRSYTMPHAEEAIPQLADDDGLYWDNSAVFNPDVHRFALEKIGPQRILWGTDNPIFYMRGRRQWKGRTYINRTSYPFFFNKEREAPEVEATYTLYLYEALKAIKDSMADLGMGADTAKAVLCENALRLASIANGGGK